MDYFVSRAKENKRCHWPIEQFRYGKNRMNGNGYKDSDIKTCMSGLLHYGIWIFPDTCPWSWERNPNFVYQPLRLRCGGTWIKGMRVLARCQNVSWINYLKLKLEKEKASDTLTFSVRSLLVTGFLECKFLALALLLSIGINGGFCFWEVNFF